jgi:hypothetical protein
MLRAMKRISQWIAVTVLAFTLSSCGLPGALARTTGNLIESASGLIGPAAAAAL